MKLNNDFKYSIQIPKFLTHEKCDELIEQITTTEEVVTGGVGGEKGEAASQAQEYDEMLEKGRESGEEVKITNPFYPTNSEEKKTLIYSSPAKPLPEKEAAQPGITSYDPAIEDKLLESRDKRK